jgi:translation elongation factor EF-G
VIQPLVEFEENSTLAAEKLDDSNANSYMFEKNVISGFNLAISSGPLCNEPIAGVLFLLEKFSVEQPPDEMDGMLFKLRF